MIDVNSPEPACASDIRDGWLPDARHLPSPNFGPRPPETTVDLLVVHSISLPPGEYGGQHIDALFQNCLRPDLHPYFETICDLRVSAHLFVDRDGRLTQYVSLLDRAWHAGDSSFLGRSNCNDYSIGIELEGCDHEPYTEAQYRSLISVSRQLNALYPDISAERVVGHCDIAPARKTDPGPYFDWQRLRSALGPRKGDVDNSLR